MVAFLRTSLPLSCFWSRLRSEGKGCLLRALGVPAWSSLMRHAHPSRLRVLLPSHSSWGPPDLRARGRPGHGARTARARGQAARPCVRCSRACFIVPLVRVQRTSSKTAVEGFRGAGATAGRGTKRGGRGARWATPPRSSFCFVSALARAAVASAVRSQPCPGVDRFVWAVEWVFVVLLTKNTPVALVNVVPWWCFGDPPLLHALATTDLLPGSWGGSREHG